MILQSLVEYYESLVAQNKLAAPGWSETNVSYAVQLDEDGNVERVISLLEEQDKKKVPIKMSVPSQVKRSSGVSANFLCDNSSYILGIDCKADKIKDDEPQAEEKRKKAIERSKECFKACGELHHNILEGIEDKTAKAVLKFFETWTPESCNSNLPLMNEVIQGANIVFWVNGEYAHENEAIRAAWKQYTDADNNSGLIRCIITGKEDRLSQLHPSIRGIRNAQSSGASLVSYNAAAFCSFGKEQGENAPTGVYAAFAYGEALNYLVRNMDYRQYIGDTAVLSYAVRDNDVYQSLFNSAFWGFENDLFSEEDIRKSITSLCQGKRVQIEDKQIDPDMDFYILGIAPNAARLSVRFFIKNSFGNILQNVEKHQQRLKVVKPVWDSEDIIPIWKMEKATCRDGANSSPQLAGELLRSILNNTNYPATLINSIDLRIRAEHNIDRTKAAIIKAYYLKNKNPMVSEEVLTVSLNKESKDKAYNLGRLFAILEMIQMKANPGINATIKDKYFGSASATPSTTFTILINLSQKHLRKIDGGLKMYYEKLIEEVIGNLDDAFPSILSLPQRGVFQLGYYHQKSELYSKKDNKEEE